MKPKVLVIEDTKQYQIVIESCLGEECELSFAATGKEAFEMLNAKKFELVLIDVVLPDMNGFQICNYIRSQSSIKETPVIMVTSNDTIEDKKKGFDLGADDYITKPFHHKELTLRVRARLNSIARRGLSEKETIQIPGFEIDLSKQHVRSVPAGHQFDFTRVEFKLFVFFCKHLDHVLSRQQILDAVWPNNLEISERTVDTHISNLRRKISGHGVQLSAVHGSGYRFSLVHQAA